MTRILMRPCLLPLGVVLAAVALVALPAEAGSASAAARPIVVSADLSSRFSGEVYRLDRSGRRVDLSRSPAQDTSPVVSPDGKRVAFLSDRTGRVALYEVGIDGRGLARISAALPIASQPIIVGWLPDNRHVLVVTERLTDPKPPYAWGLTLMSYARGERPRILAKEGTLNGINVPAISPDGRLVAYENRDVTDQRVVATDGGPGFAFARDWSGQGQMRLVWSAQNRLAALFDHAVHVYDEAGHLLARYPANDFAWSPTGEQLASIDGGIVEVHGGGGSGRALLRERLFPASLIQQIVRSFGQNMPELAWAGGRRLLVANVELGTQTGSYGPSPYATVNVSLSVPVGKTSKPSEQAWFAATCGCVSSDGKLLAQTPNFGTTLAIQASSPSGANARTVEQVPGCWDDGTYTADVTALQWAAGPSLVYASWCTTPPADLYTVAATGAMRALTHNVKLTATDPALSPDGTQIAFAQAGAPNSCRGCAATIWTMNTDGSDLHAVTEPPPNGAADTWDTSPSWSPDGTQIVYSHATTDSFGVLYVVNASGGTPTALHVNGASPSWGPTRIAYLGNTNIGGTHITLRTITPDGKNVETLTTGALASPAWTVSGELAALDLRARPQAVEVIGGTVRRVALPFADATRLAWSADGTRLLVVARRLSAGPYDLYSVKPDGTAVQRLTTNVGALGVAP
jgi:Tol biopolymer transport system component